MIILRNFSESEKKIKYIDKARISELQRHKKERDIRKDQYSEDPEIRKKANKKDVKRFLAGAGAIAAGYTALGAGIYGATKLPNSVKDKLNLRKDLTRDDFKEAVTTFLPKVALGTGAGLTAKAISNKRRNKRIKEGNLNTRDKKTIDQIKVAEGEMTREEYIEKWGK